MEKRSCVNCGRFYCGGSLIVTDWAYWSRNKERVICPECQGVDVAEEIRLASEAIGAQEPAGD